MNDFRNRAPKVDLLVAKRGATAPTLEVPRFVLPELPVERKIDAEIEDYIRSNQLVSMSTEGISRISRIAPPLASTHNAIERYNTELESHLDEYRNWLKLRHVLEIAKSRSFEFSIWITNGGNLPADDLDMKIEFPDSIVRIVEETQEGASELELQKCHDRLSDRRSFSLTRAFAIKWCQ